MGGVYSRSGHREMYSGAPGGAGDLIHPRKIDVGNFYCHIVELEIALRWSQNFYQHVYNFLAHGI